MAVPSGGVGTVTVGAGPTGVAVDADGRVWSTDYNAGTVSRINPELGPVGLDGETPVGAVDFTTPYLGGQPYNYSDMTGSTLTGMPQSGTWTATFDSGEALTDWAAVAWRHQAQCDGGDVEVRVSTSENGTTFSTPVEATSGDLLAGVAPGRYVLRLNSKSGTREETLEIPAEGVVVREVRLAP